MVENSNFVSQVDAAFAFIIGVALFFLVAITAVMIYFVVRYRRARNPESTHIEGSNTLEIIWTVIPTILVMVMFYYGWAGWHPQTTPPKDAFPIKSIARMWQFTFEYPNGKVTDTLYVPKDQAVKLDLVALDVIHSLYIPAFRVKMDMVPGRDLNMWFKAQVEGEYDLYCAEYCGLNHSYMVSTVKVLSNEAFDKWYTDTTQIASSNQEVDARSAGGALAKRLGCVACHSTDGVNLVGPSFKGLHGSQKTIAGKGGETTITVDDAYLIESILDPNAKIVKGYNAGLMLSYKDQLKDGEIEQLVEYLKSLK
jgi:cytochrome c oxidase subunit II